MIWLEITLSRIFPVIQKPLQLSTSQASCTRNSETRLTRIQPQYYPWKSSCHDHASILSCVQLSKLFFYTTKWSHILRTPSLHQYDSVAIYWNFSELSKTSVISSNTSCAFGFWKILCYDVSRFCVWPMLLRWPSPCEPSRAAINLFGALSHRERAMPLVSRSTRRVHPFWRDLNPLSPNPA